MKAFVTGGTGFIGRQVIEQLLARGDQVYALVRSEKGAEAVRRPGAQPVRGDITDQASMAEAMRGCDVVFHLAAWYQVGSLHQEQAEQINVDGTRHVLELAHELGVPRIVYTSSMAVFGDTHGQIVDESYRMPEGQSFLTEYDRTKWKAHFEVAVPLIERGAPVIIVMPGAVYGPGDTSQVGEILRWFYRGWLPLLPGPDTTLTYAHVADIARAHLLAADHGQPGETYITAGPAVSLRKLLAMASAITGRPAPLAYVPSRFLRPLAPLLEKAAAFLPLPTIFSRDAVMMLDTSYLGRASKAQTELGWGTRDLREGLRETLDSIASETPTPLIPRTRRKQLAGIALGLGVLSLFSWLFLRRRSQS